MNKPEKYSPALDMEARVDNLVILLQDANCSSPANGAAANLWKDKAAFKKQVHAFYNGLVVCFRISRRTLCLFEDLLRNVKRSVRFVVVIPKWRS